MARLIVEKDISKYRIAQKQLNYWTKTQKDNQRWTADLQELRLRWSNRCENLKNPKAAKSPDWKYLPKKKKKLEVSSSLRRGDIRSWNSCGRNRDCTRRPRLAWEQLLKVNSLCFDPCCCLFALVVVDFCLLLIFVCCWCWFLFVVVVVCC